MDLGNDFERAAKEVLMDGVERQAREELAPRLREKAHDALRAYGDRHGYDVESVIETSKTSVRREGDRVVVTVGWEAEQAVYFAAGVSPRTIDGNPVLSFIWEDAPQGIREAFSDTERVGGDPRVYLESVDHPGIPESRFVREGLHHLRRSIE